MYGKSLRLYTIKHLKCRARDCSFRDLIIRLVNLPKGGMFMKTTEKSKNISLSFDAKYQAEDAASLILHKYYKQALKEGYVNGEQFCLRLGLTPNCNYVFGGNYKQALGIFAVDAQCMNITGGEKLILQAGNIFINKTITNEANYKLCNYTIINLLSNFFFQRNMPQSGNNMQLSFGLDTTQSTKNAVVSIDSINESLAQNRLDSVDNFAQALIMPKNRFKLAVNNLFTKLKVNRNSDLTQEQLNSILQDLSNIFMVPEPYVLCRLKCLNYV